jgi:hypothetical protein
MRNLCSRIKITRLEITVTVHLIDHARVDWRLEIKCTVTVMAIIGRHCVRDMTAHGWLALERLVVGSGKLWRRVNPVPAGRDAFCKARHGQRP